MKCKTCLAGQMGQQELDENGEVAIRVVKNANPSNPHTIDALSGVTLTNNGVGYSLLGRRAKLRPVPEEPSMAFIRKSHGRY